MKLKLLSVAVALVALLWAAPAAFAGGSGGPGGAQAGVQNASTNQGALGVAASNQNAVNANVPVSVAGGNIYSGPSNATQTATSTATTDVSNHAKTDQNQWLNQNIDGGMACKAGCGGAGGFQAGVQNAQTNQLAAGAAVSKQNAVNANVPVNIAGGNVTSGPSNATQTASSSANADVSNHSKTDQDQSQNQNIGGSGCYAGCGGAGGFQLGVQNAETNQAALGAAVSKQNAVNANVPVNIAGGNVTSGPSNATQTATSNATADVSNHSKTDQDQHLNQNIGGGSCKLGCGGAGGFQAGIQNAETNQLAIGLAKSDQNAVNANTPVNIAGGNVYSGPSNATQTATSSATTDVSNHAKTDQDQGLCQNIGSSSSSRGCDGKKGRDDGYGKDGRDDYGRDGKDSRDGKDGKDGCYAGCGGAGGLQLGVQNSKTNQGAFGFAFSNQNAVNGNAPVNIAGGNVTSGPSNATQTATSDATADVSNHAKTDQDQHLNQNIGGGSCKLGCGGAGGFQLGLQNAETNQLAIGLAKSDQNAVNANAPVNVAGYDVKSGPSNATQTASSSATTDVSNYAKTDHDQALCQNIGGKGRGCDGKRDGRDGRDGKDMRDGHDRYGKDGRGGKDGCYAGCGGPGGFQLGLQNSKTNQAALGFAFSNQNAVNSNTPHSIAGGNIYDGSSNATQTATSTGTTDVSNRAKTDQNQWLKQQLGVWRI